jgi:hypothetical protein
MIFISGKFCWFKHSQFSQLSKLSQFRSQLGLIGITYRSRFMLLKMWYHPRWSHRGLGPPCCHQQGHEASNENPYKKQYNHTCAPLFSADKTAFSLIFLLIRSTSWPYLYHAHLVSTQQKRVFAGRHLHVFGYPKT